jgi:tetratricopeptide (TPR) repeat protein
MLVAIGLGLFLFSKAGSSPDRICAPPRSAVGGCEEQQGYEFAQSTAGQPGVPDPAALLAQAKQLYAAGTQLAEQGKVEAAMGRFEEAIALCPGFAPAHCNLGVALYQKGEIREALQQLSLAVQIDPDLADAHFSMGNILLLLDRYPESAVQFREVVRLRPEDADAHSNLALALDRQGNIAEAVKQYREVVRISPENLTVARQLAWYLATCPDANVRNADEALSLAKRVVQEAGSRVPILLDTLAAAYASAGNFDDAVEVAQNALADATNLWKTTLAREIEARLKLYRAKMPYRERAMGEPNQTAPSE